MSISLVTKTTDTSTGVNPTTLSVGAFNYSSDWRVKSNKPEEAILTNLTAPTSYPETLRFARRSVANIYNGWDVERALWLPTKVGFELVGQLKTIYGLADSADATYEAALPISTHLVVKAPNNELITPTVVLSHIRRLLNGFYEIVSSTQTSRLPSLMRGALIPIDL